MAKYYVSTPLGAWFRAPGHGHTLDVNAAHAYDFSDYRDFDWVANLVDTYRRLHNTKTDAGKIRLRQAHV